MSARLRVRYTAHDGGNGYVVEAGADAFEVLSFGCIPGPDPIPAVSE